MRIIAGVWRGRTIKTPKGVSTRPTSDRVREALFSSLTSLMGSFDRVRVLDPFAGSGALGLEALSRGAEHVTFIEKDRTARAVLNENIAHLDADTSTTVHGGDAASLLREDFVSSPVSLLLLDPPYRINKAEVSGIIETLVRSGVLLEGAVIVWEHAAGETPCWPPMARQHSNRRYGSTELDLAIVASVQEDR